MTGEKGRQDGIRINNAVSAVNAARLFRTVPEITQHKGKDNCNKTKTLRSPITPITPATVNIHKVASDNFTPDNAFCRPFWIICCAKDYKIYPIPHLAVCRYLPLNPNSWIIRIPVQTTSQSPQCYSAQLIQNLLDCKDFNLVLFVRIKRDQPVFSLLECHFMQQTIWKNCLQQVFFPSCWSFSTLGWKHFLWNELWWTRWTFLLSQTKLDGIGYYKKYCFVRVKSHLFATKFSHKIPYLTKFWWKTKPHTTAETFPHILDLMRLDQHQPSWKAPRAPAKTSSSKPDEKSPNTQLPPTNIVTSTNSARSQNGIVLQLKYLGCCERSTFRGRRFVKFFARIPFAFQMNLLQGDMNRFPPSNLLCGQMKLFPPPIQTGPSPIRSVSPFHVTFIRYIFPSLPPSLPQLFLAIAQHFFSLFINWV